MAVKERVYDLSNATLCDPDSPGVQTIIPRSVYGRRVRAMHISCDDIWVAYIRLTAKSLRFMGGGPYMVEEGLSNKGRKCMMIKGDKGTMVLGRNYTSLPHGIYRNIITTVESDGRLCVIV